MKKLKKNFFFSAFLVIALMLCPLTARAASYEDLSVGTYDIEASLSCYVNAMGGVEFGEPLLSSAEIAVREDGAYITLYFTKSSVTIYSVTCDTFIDASPAYVTDDRGVENGVIGIYDENGELVTENVEYTLSDDTALNAGDEEVHYVDSITYLLLYQSDEYSLALYINSNVMGVEFCNENESAESQTYPATLSVNWNSLDNAIVAEETSEANSTEAAAANENLENDGLSVHYADGGSGAAADTGSATVQAYMNIPLLTAAGCIAAAFIIGGTVLILISRKPKSEINVIKETKNEKNNR
ncbi:MAG: hypothetical protein LUF33_05000 [Clostridiales bacterium]|nr:hypothetical protein [Clostridiales bacterium]